MKEMSVCTSSANYDPRLSTLFDGIFGGKVMRTVCEDIGEDTNLLDKALLQKFHESKFLIDVQELPTAFLY